MTDEHRKPGHVRQVYDTIAEHFSQTRRNPWPEVQAFLEGVDPVALGLDVGCGNGRHTERLAAHCERAIGLDLSRELLGLAAERRGRDTTALVQGHAARLPLGDDAVDLGLYVATLHHLPDRETRIASLSELARVLASDGRALVSAWSTTHDRFTRGSETDGFDTTVDWTLPGGRTVPRYYHIYAPAEFERDIRDSDLTLTDRYVSSGNCYAEVRA
ncbi:MAG: class I SAM-dependent methyltransferase [Halovenus sp.]